MQKNWESLFEIWMNGIQRRKLKSELELGT